MTRVSEQVSLDRCSVEVRYGFHNESRESIELPIAFPMPVQLFFDYWKCESLLEQFGLWVDGVPEATDRCVECLLTDDTDISRRIQDAHWMLQMSNAFIGGGVLSNGVASLPEPWFGEVGANPLRPSREYFVWNPIIPPGDRVEIRHRDVPSVGSGVPWPTVSVSSEFGDSHGIDPARVGTLTRVSADDRYMFRNRLEYMLTTGVHWKGGALGHFILRIHKRHPRDLVSLCFDGDPEKIDDVTFECSQQNLRPLQNLDVLFICRDGPC